MDETRKLHVVYPNSLLWDLERLRGGLEGLGLGVILGKRDIALGDWRMKLLIYSIESHRNILMNLWSNLNLMLPIRYIP